MEIMGDDSIKDTAVKEQVVNDYETGDKYLANGSKANSCKVKAVCSKKPPKPEQHFKHKQTNKPVTK